MILRGLSMNPELLDYTTLFKYFDKIPSPQFYQLLIGLIPVEYKRKFYPWIKSSKKPYKKQLISLFSTYYEISSKEAIEYIKILFSTENGKKELENLCSSFGLTERETEEAMERKDDED